MRILSLLVACLICSSMFAQGKEYAGADWRKVAIITRNVPCYEDSRCYEENWDLEAGEVYPINASEGNCFELDNNAETFYVRKDACRVETWTAAAGHGWIWREGGGYANIRSAPNTKARILGRLRDIEDSDEDYPCLGKVDGWYKIDYNGKIGYVSAGLVTWWVHGYDMFGTLR